MANCPFCGFQNQDYATHCANCASPLNTRPPVVGTTRPGNNNSRTAVVVIMALVGMAGAGAAAYFVTATSQTPATSPSVRGTLVSVGEPHGSFVMEPSQCRSGERDGYFGVWLSNDRTGVKVVKPVRGQWEIYLQRPDGTTGQVGFSDCSEFDVMVENTGATVGDSQLRRGHVYLQCDFDQGGTVTSSVTFEGCS